MTLKRCPLFVLLATSLGVAALLVSSCQQAEESPGASRPSSVRSTPHATVGGALSALESGDYGQFPALVGLALTLKPHAARNPTGETPLLQERDFEKVREILRAAQGAPPRITDNGKLAAYNLPGHGLIRDELHLFRHRDEWFFIVD